MSFLRHSSLNQVKDLSSFVTLGVLTNTAASGTTLIALGMAIRVTSQKPTMDSFTPVLKSSTAVLNQLSSTMILKTGLSVIS